MSYSAYPETSDVDQDEFLLVPMSPELKKDCIKYFQTMYYAQPAQAEMEKLRKEINRKIAVEHPEYPVDANKGWTRDYQFLKYKRSLLGAQN